MIKVIIVTIALIVAGCSSVPFAGQRFERVILLPSESAKPSALVVKTGDAEALLDKPYAAVDIRGDRLVMTRSSPEEVALRYGELLSAEPRAPKVYTLFFITGTDELTPASKVAFEESRKQVASWPAAEIVVIGHTDATGSTESNETLSLDRASIIAARLRSAGIPPEAIEVASRGEREPLVLTARGIAEPLNRRVEIKVR